MNPFYTSGSRLLPHHFGGAMHHCFHPQFPLKSHQNHHWMTWHPQPPPSLFNLLIMAWTCWTKSLHSWLTWLLFQEGENQHPFPPISEAHQPPIPLSPYQAHGTFITQTTQRPYTKFTLHFPQSNYHVPRHMHTILANEFHRAKFKPKSSSNTSSPKKANR